MISFNFLILEKKKTDTSLEEMDNKQIKKPRKTKTKEIQKEKIPDQDSNEGYNLEKKIKKLAKTKNEEPNEKKGKKFKSTFSEIESEKDEKKSLENKNEKNEDYEPNETGIIETISEEEIDVINISIN